MFKSIIKIFLPSPDSLSQLCVDKISDKINNSQKNEVIAQYSSYINDVSKIVTQLSENLSDGKIDKQEAEKIKTLIKPIFEKLYELL
jgi:hypothetical protein